MRTRPDNSRIEQVLSLLMETGSISRKTMTLTGIYPSKQTMWLHRLEDAGLIQKREMEAGKAYIITAQGVKYLREINGQRHSDDAAVSGLNADMTLRKASMSEVVALLKLAGYNTHRDDKPTVFTAVENMQALKSLSREEHNDALCSPDNARHYQYRFQGCFDRKTYTRRQTAMNCFYTSKELKDYIAGPMQAQFQMSIEPSAISFSRIAGLLCTSTTSYRVYNTGKTAMKVRMGGENAMRIMLADLVSGMTGKKGLRVEDVLIFGDRFKGALRLVDVSRKASLRIPQKNQPEQKYPSTSMQISMIGHRVFYLPLLSCSKPLLQLMQYPGWSEFLREMAFGEDYRAMEDAHSIFDGYMDGLPVYLELVPDLRRLESLVHYLQYVEVEQLLIACLDWQKPFYEQVLAASIGIESSVRFYCFSQDDVESALEALRLHYIKEDSCNV